MGTENHHGGGRRGKVTERCQEGYFRQVVWTGRENERDGQGKKKMRDHTGKGRNWKHGKNLGITKKDREE